MSEELHVAGIVVHAYPDQVERVARAITRLSGAQVHATAPDGKLIVTLEAPSAREIAAQLEALQRLEAVLSASLVYQHNEPLAAMMEEVSHETHTPGIH
jgi:nitrate reductase NapD